MEINRARLGSDLVTIVLKSRNGKSPSSQRRVFPPPKVVILPGPHKTGSTSVQTCLVDWSWNGLSMQIRQRRDHPVRTPLALPKWAWAVPDEIVLKRAKLLHVHPTKAFASLMGIADLDPLLGLSPKGRNDTGYVVSSNKLKETVKLYQTSMEQAWQNNFNILYGSEEMDRLVSPVHSNSSFLMDTILSILPWNSSKTTRKLNPDDVEVVLVHRTPRVKHLISVWHQERIGKESFRSYLMRRVLPHARYMDALGVAQQFLRRNFRTTILDLNGVTETYGNRTNTCHVIACDILQTEKCTDDTHRLKSLASKPHLDISDRPQNERSNKGAMDVTARELDVIDNIMTEYDCGFRDSLVRFHNRSLLRFLYNDNIFSRCQDIKNGTKMPQRSLRWMVYNIRGVIRM